MKPNELLVGAIEARCNIDASLARQIAMQLSRTQIVSSICENSEGARRLEEYYAHGKEKPKQ